MNECEQQPPLCDLSAYCADTVGSFECTCHPGYEGDGRTCVLNGELSHSLTMMHPKLMCSTFHINIHIRN